MRNVILLSVIGICLAGGAMAQSAETQNVEGCLSHATHGGWALTGGRDNATQYRLRGGDEGSLQKLNGHTVRVAGEVTTSDPAKQAITPPGPMTTTGVTYKIIQVQNVQNVTANCSEFGSSRK